MKQHLNLTMTENYAQPGKEDITLAVDRLQQDVRASVPRSLSWVWTAWFTTSPSLPPQFKCCGSNNSGDWAASGFVTSGQAAGRVVPDSCCKTVTPMCGRRNHPSNIYRVEVSTPAAHSVFLSFCAVTLLWPLQGGCISKLEQFLADHLLVIGAVGIGVACLQVKNAPELCLCQGLCFGFLSVGSVKSIKTLFGPLFNTRVLCCTNLCGDLKCLCLWCGRSWPGPC